MYNEGAINICLSISDKSFVIVINDVYAETTFPAEVVRYLQPAGLD